MVNTVSHFINIGTLRMSFEWMSNRQCATLFMATDTEAQAQVQVVSLGVKAEAQSKIGHRTAYVSDSFHGDKNRGSASTSELNDVRGLL